MEVNKVPLEKTSLVHSFQCSQKSYQVNKEGQSLAGTAYFEDLEEKKINPNLKMLQVKSDGLMGSSRDC